nr:EOG090X09QP [Leptodora kindtii]
MPTTHAPVVPFAAWTKNTQALDLAGSWGAGLHPSSSSDVVLFVKRPKALAPSTRSRYDYSSSLNELNLFKLGELNGLQNYSLQLERQYTLAVINQHLSAKQFLKHCKGLSKEDDAVGCLGDMPLLHQTLKSMSVDHNSFAAYFSGQLSDREKHILQVDSGLESTASSQNNDGNRLPTPEQLQRVSNVLAETLPRIFIQPMDYTVYSNDVVFENRIRGTRTEGLYNYVKQVAILRCVGHLKYGYVRFEILKLTQNPEEGTIKVRWRIRGISGLKILFTFWRYKLWQWKDLMERQESWHDGFSTFHVSSAGTIYLHVADKMMADEEKVGKLEVPLAAKIALLLGGIPKEDWNMSEIADHLLMDSMENVR